MLPKSTIFILAVGLIGLSSGRPQDVDPDIVSEIFGPKSAVGAGSYGAQAPSAVVQVVKSPGRPADYVDSPNNYENNKANVEVDKQFAKCSDYKEAFGYECVPYYQCANGTIITDGAGLIDIRGGFADLNPTDSKCQGLLDVCCKNPDFVPPPPPKLRYQPRCGRHNQEGVGARIQGFKEGEAQFGEWPHMCAVLETRVDQYGAETNQYVCGGSLIAPGIVLTAAHCANKFRANPGALKVRCGEWDTQRKVEPYSHQDRNTASLFVHPEFNAKTLANDVALLFMQTPFELDYHVDTVCLPRPNEAFDFSRCVATGWGKDRFGSSGAYQVVLKEIELDAVGNRQCETSLRGTRLGQFFKLHQSFMCAGGNKGKDTCTGDGGSPLVCPSRSDPNTFTQAGIVAWGIGCGEGGVPGVYASVSQAVCWIDYVASCQANSAATGQTARPSFFGLSDAECGAWLQQSRSAVDARYGTADGVKETTVLDILKATYNRCEVQWVKAAPAPADLNEAGGYPRIAEPSSDLEPAVRIDSEVIDTIYDTLVEEDKDDAEEESTGDEVLDDDSAVNFS